MNNYESKAKKGVSDIEDIEDDLDAGVFAQDQRLKKLSDKI